MARIIEIHKFNFKNLIKSLKNELRIKNEQNLKKILLFFGEKVGDYFFIVNNEIEFGRSSFYNAAIFLDRYFNGYSAMNVFLKLSERLPANRTIEQAENALGVELPANSFSA